ncbi:hypothetical protein IJG72_01785 [bacterium]|nr:hypothetical protein [bacterium]
MIGIYAKVEKDSLRKELVIKNVEKQNTETDLMSVADTITKYEAVAGGNQEALQKMKSEDKKYQELIRYQEAYQLKIENLSVEIDLMTQEMENLEAVEQEDLKKSGKITCFGN